MRSFNIAGPCRPEWHYMIPAEGRLPSCEPLVDKGAYFTVHAPRQTGKTTAMRTLAAQLTAAGKYAALHFSCEDGGAWDEDIGAAQRALLREIDERAEQNLPSELRPPPFSLEGDEGLLRAFLADWARACPRPLVLIFDEIDSLRGNSLISVLRQLRAGYDERPTGSPWSVILCGMRDVRDYKAASGGGEVRLGSASPFNIKEESLRLGNFSEAELRALYRQHTDETGQVFTEEALLRAFELTQGQPWLVNALAREVVEKMKVPLDEPVLAEHIDTAKERIILARATHLDSLLARLNEERVRRVLEPVLAGELPYDDPYNDDYQYVADLGLIKPGMSVEIANPIYREIIVRVLATGAERAVTADSKSYLQKDGRLDSRRMLEDFAEFWREHGDILAARMTYAEVAPQLVLMAYLHKVVNGGGAIHREVGVGRKRIDLVVEWPYRDAHGQRALQRTAFELKVWRDRDKKGDPLSQGLSQLDAYLARLGLDEGVLVIFDAREKAAPIDERTHFEEMTTEAGRKVTLLRA